MSDLIGAVLLALLLAELGLPIYFSLTRRPIIAKYMALTMLYGGVAGFVGGCVSVSLWARSQGPPQDAGAGFAMAFLIMAAPLWGIMVGTPCLMLGGILGAVWGRYREQHLVRVGPQLSHAERVPPSREG